MTLDAHAHLWKPSQGFDIKPLRDTPAFTARDWLPEDIAPEMARLGIGRVIITQSAPQVAETRALLDHCRGNPIVAGVVGWADLASDAGLGEAAALLDDPLVLGLRLQLRRMPDGYVSRPEVGRGLDLIEENGKVAVFLSEARHHTEVLEVLRRRPGLRAVLNHGGLPDIAGGRIDEWEAAMRRFASETAVVTQLSGLVSLAGRGWTREALRGPAARIFEIFGPERIMVASDWPMPVAHGVGYGDWWDIAADLMDGCGLTAEEKRSVLGEVARRVHL